MRKTSPTRRTLRMNMAITCAARISECLFCSTSRAIHGLNHADLRICLNQCITYAHRGLSHFNCYRIYSPLHKPAAEVAAGNRRSPFKEQITLLSTDPDGITVSLATGLLRRGRADIGHFVDFIFCSIFPSDGAGKHPAGFVEADVDRNINLDGCIHGIQGGFPALGCRPFSTENCPPDSFPGVSNPLTPFGSSNNAVFISKMYCSDPPGHAY